MSRERCPDCNKIMRCVTDSRGIGPFGMKKRTRETDDVLSCINENCLGKEKEQEEEPITRRKGGELSRRERRSREDKE